MEINVGIDNATGSPLWREADYFIGGIKERKITVYYRQWLTTPTGVRLREENTRKYIIIDEPAITKRGAQILVTPEVLSENGLEVISPAVYREGELEVVKPANLQYTNWRQFIITNQLVGAKLGDDIIIGAINRTLAELPTDVVDGYIIQTPE